MSALPVVPLAALFAVGTLAAGWWAVVLVALVAGLALADRRPIALHAALAAAAGWAALLGWTAARGPLAAFAARLAGAMGLPAFAPPALTLLFPALLAWSAAAVGQGVVALARGARRP